MFEIKDITVTARYGSCCDLYLEDDCKCVVKKDFTIKEMIKFSTVNFRLICSNFPAAPVYGVYITQLNRYSRACGSYQVSLMEGCC